MSAHAASADVVIVGAGSAGCLLAERLSRDRTLQVLLLEAGPRDRSPWIHIPVGFSRLLHDPAVNWCFATAEQRELADRRLHWPRGRVVGGSGSINGMVWVRGQPADYDRWASETGDSAWGWDEVSSLFRSGEDAPEDAGDRLGRGGDMPLSRVPAVHPLARAFVASGVAQGYPRRGDLSISDSEGFGEYLITTRRGLRASPATVYLRQASGRPNLRVMERTHVLGVALSGAGEASGVRVRRGASREVVSARRGVILSAGAIGSPHLLMLSGIGPGEDLDRAGVRTQIDRPGVGRNLQDHLGARLVGRVRRPITINDDFRRPWRLAGHAIRYALTRRGPLAIGGAYAGAFLRSDASATSPDVQAHFVPLSSQMPGWKFDRFPGFTVNVCQLRPWSSGRITLGSADPLEPPTIDPGYLTDPRDRTVLLAGLEKVRTVLGTDPLSREFGAREARPGPEVQTPEALLEYVRATAQTVYHPVGSCRTGADDQAVVDARLRVRGVPNLWVIDASVMPSLPSGNTNAAVLMIAERGAMLVRDELSSQ